MEDIAVIWRWTTLNVDIFHHWLVPGDGAPKLAWNLIHGTCFWQAGTRPSFFWLSMHVLFFLSISILPLLSQITLGLEVMRNQSWLPCCSFPEPNRKVLTHRSTQGGQQSILRAYCRALEVLLTSFCPCPFLFVSPNRCVCLSWKGFSGQAIPIHLDLEGRPGPSQPCHNLPGRANPAGPSPSLLFSRV